MNQFQMCEFLAQVAINKQLRCHCQIHVQFARVQVVSPSELFNDNLSKARRAIARGLLREAAKLLRLVFTSGILYFGLPVL